MTISVQLESTKALSRLCLMSKRLWIISRELLYQTVLIHDAERLLLFWRSIKVNPHLGRFIRELGVWVALSHLGFVERMARISEEISKPTEHQEDLVLYKRLKDCVWCELPFDMVADILYRAPGLANLSLEVPAASDNKTSYSVIARCWDTKDENGQWEPMRALRTLELCHPPSPMRPFERRLWTTFDPLD
ncbi:hypothetical protein QBC38DRAFT_234325 [Podospora fimiseda]|uniref:Uncharacterized protein n=1 Tax=Podospora fimiseda TaxID=252190 RepID=A0AAN7GXA0_9PEZI|nr:hypothetical protein QBC38DRAFT_234325 [Podospora fimiseda]